MTTKKIADKDLSEAANSFFENVKSAVCNSDAAVVSAMNDMLAQRRPNRMVDGVIFAVTDELEEQHQLIVSRAAKLLGPAAGNEKEISTRLWKLAVQHVQGSSGEPRKCTAKLFDELADLKSRELTYVAPSLALRMLGGLKEFEVGPVRILAASLSAARINEANENEKWSAVTGQPGIEYHGDGTAHVKVPEVAWWVTVVSAPDHLEEEAVWQIDVLLSLLRLSAPGRLGPFVGELGTIDPHPSRPRPPSGALTLTPRGGVSAGGLRTPPILELTPETRSHLEAIGFDAIAQAIFASKKDSVGERVFRGLGWLSRGRQASDRSERFIFFFTGLEALLSSDDKAAPVVQTISRHAASLLSDDNQARGRNAKVVKKLYESRSALVHGGARRASQREVNTAEHILSYCLWRVIDGVSMSMPYRELQEELTRASFGLPFNAEHLGWLATASSSAPLQTEEVEEAAEMLANRSGLGESEANFVVKHR